MVKSISGINFSVPRNYLNIGKNNITAPKVNLNYPCDSVSFKSRVENDTKSENSYNPPRIIMLGAPASGKGTLTEFLKKDLKLSHIDMGGMLRAAVKEESELGKQALAYMSEGKLVPDEVAIGIVRERLAKDDCKKGFILDGFPRTIEQAKVLDEIFAETSGEVKVINIDLDLSKEEFLDRIVNRRLCSDKSCGSVYNTKFKPPKEEGICDKCHSPLEHRKDDTEEIAMSRLESYERQTKPLVEYYSNQGKLITIKASNGSSSNYDIIKESMSEVYEKPSEE